MKTTITADQSRRARRSLGITQAKLAEETGLNATLIKHFETYRIENPPQDFQRKLVDYYAGKGLDVAAPANSTVASEERKPGANIVKDVAIPRISFLVSDKLSQEEIEALLERMEENDDHIYDLVKKETAKGLFGGHSDATVSENQELFASLAENYLIFRHLQGRNLFNDIDQNAKAETHGHLLHGHFTKSPIAHKLVSPEAGSTAAGNLEKE